MAKAKIISIGDQYIVADKIVSFSVREDKMPTYCCGNTVKVYVDIKTLGGTISIYCGTYNSWEGKIPQYEETMKARDELIEFLKKNIEELG